MRTSGRNRRAVRSLVAAAALLSAASSAVAADVTSAWINATDGTWSDGANWDMGVPDNGAQTYSAVIGAIGSAYAVTLNSSVTINDLLLNSADATLRHTAGTLSVVSSPINLTAGTFRLHGGTISGGSIVQSGGAMQFSPGGGLLHNVTLNGDMDLSEAGANVRLANGAIFSGDANLGQGAILSFQQNAAINSGQTINMDGYANLDVSSDLAFTTDNTLTIDAGATVRGWGFINGGYNGSVSSSNTVVNNGLISADGNDAYMYIQSPVFTNTGTTQAINACSLYIFSTNWSNSGSINVVNNYALFSGNWSNAGSLILTDATLEMAGSFSSSSVSGISRSGSTQINIIGWMDNTAATLNLTAATGDIRLVGGTIVGGTISESGGSLVFTASGGILDNAAINGDLSLTESSAHVRLMNGAGYSGGANITGSIALLVYQQTDSIESGQTVNLDNSGQLNVSYDPTAVADSTLTIDSGATVRGQGYLSSGIYGTIANSNTIINDGLISADLSGGYLYVQPDIFTNNGTAQAVNGAFLQITSANWSNGGSINVDNSSAYLAGNWNNTGSLIVTDGTLDLGGSFSSSSVSGVSRSGTTQINISGFMDNTAATLNLTAATGDLRLLGGTIAGGAINQTGAALQFTPSGGILDGAAVSDDLDLSATSALVRLWNGATFGGDANLGSGAYLGFQQDHTLGAGQTIHLNSYGTVDVSHNPTTNVDSVLTIAPGATVHGTGYLNTGGYGSIDNTNTIVNNGLISADVTGFIQIYAGNFVNNGTTEAINGALLYVFSSNWSNAGSIIVDGGYGYFGGTWLNTGSLILADATLDLGGLFTSSSVSGISRSGASTINLLGLISNTAATLNLTAATGDLHLRGGTIVGGTINQTGAQLVGTTSGGILVEVALDGDLNLMENNSSVRLQHGASFSGDAHLGSNALLSFRQTSSLTSGQTVNLGGGYLDVSSNAANTTDNTLAIDAGAMVRGSGSIYSGWYGTVSNSNTVINNGTIRADVNGGDLVIQPNVFTNNGTLRAEGGGRLILNNAAGDLNSVEVDGTNSLARVGGTYTIDEFVSITNRGTVHFKGNWTKSATIDASGFVIFDHSGSSPLPALWSDIATGRNGGAWNGPGINSSAAAANSALGVGIGESSDVLGVSGGYFGGEYADGTSVLVRWTYLGDTNLDGQVTISDLGDLASNWQSTSAVWRNGDFNYDGQVTISDLGDLASNWQAGVGSPLAMSFAEALALVGFGEALVPEPAGVLQILVMMGLARRRRAISR